MESSSSIAIELSDFEKGHTVSDIGKPRAALNTSLGQGDKGVSVTWKNLSYSVELKKSMREKDAENTKTARSKTILHGLSGAVLPGQMLAIMGGSGAGKSTLLDILANRKSEGTIEGTLAYNGQPVDSEISALLKRVTGYVTQEDIFLKTATVRENLRFFCKLTLADSTTAEQHAAVEDVMKELNIDHVADSPIGGVTDSRGLSGGEKKRVSIAEQLLRNPLVLFLDEPTSGLDAYNSQSVMQLLQGLAERRRMTIVTSIHQPRSSIYSLFDQLLLLDKGQTAYFGPASSAQEYFAQLGFPLKLGFNPADFMIDVVLGKENREVEFSAKFQESELSTRMISLVDDTLSSASVLTAEPLPFYASSYATQLQGLLARWARDMLRNPEAALINMVQAIILGVIVGSIFYNLTPETEAGIFSISGLLFFMILSAAFPITSVAILMVQNRAITNREMASGTYSVVPLWLTRLLLDLPVHLIIPVLFNVTCYWMADLNSNIGRFFIHLGIMILTCWTAGSLYTVLGSISPDALSANILAFVLTVILSKNFQCLFWKMSILISKPFTLVLFGGFFTDVPVWWVYMEYISFIRWSFVAAMANQFVGTGPRGDAAMELFDLQGWNVWNGVLGLVGQLIIYRLLALVTMKYVNREKR